MSEDLTKKPQSDTEKLTLILEALEALRIEVRSMRRDIFHRFGILHDTLVETQVDHYDVHKRISQLELSQDPPNSQT